MFKPSENLTVNPAAESIPSTAEFSPQQRRVLLAIAHHAIALRLAGKPFTDWAALRRESISGNSILGGIGGSAFPPAPPTDVPPEAWAALQAPRGVFTTLYLRHALRGCVGYVAAVRPLHQAVAETACAAAFEDSRFWPVTAEEAPQLKISLSVLSETFPIDPAHIEVGRHGLVISDGSRRGLLLPQVAVDHAWDRETFLAETCRKARLPLDAWKRKSATVEAFVAEVFSDDRVPG